ncbi:MAG: hypothetical protein Q8928_04775 [Bacteroidota bacterium]|nr:hypothetical protein [Bacteroidota bacterium]
MKFTILYDFSKFSDEVLVMRIDYLIKCLTGNKNFANPNPTLDQLIASLETFRNAILASVNGTKRDTALKNQLRKDLELLVRTLGMYVQSVGNNDEAILTSSGFELKKPKTSIGLLPKPENFKVMEGPYAASAKLSVNSIYGADVYVYKYAIAPVNENTPWEIVLGKSSVVIKDLIQGKEYTFKVAAKGASEELIFSEPVNKFIS